MGSPESRSVGGAGTPASSHTKERPEGPAAAALLAAGIGAAALGVTTTLAVVSETVKDWLGFSESVGPLPGKTIVAVVVWLLAWIVLHPLLRRSRVSNGILIATGILVLVGVVGTFPIFFEAFASE